jgi:hypothetical protein
MSANTLTADYCVNPAIDPTHPPITIQPLLLLLLRSIGASSGPYIAGLLYASASTQDYPWIIAGSLKIAYDLLLLASFQAVKPASEAAKERRESVMATAREVPRAEAETGTGRERYIEAKR